jgi:hypothetical protein
MLVLNFDVTIQFWLTQLALYSPLTL